MSSLLFVMGLALTTSILQEGGLMPIIFCTDTIASLRSFFIFTIAYYSSISVLE